MSPSTLPGTVEHSSMALTIHVIKASVWFLEPLMHLGWKFGDIDLGFRSKNPQAADSLSSLSHLPLTIKVPSGTGHRTFPRLQPAPSIAGRTVKGNHGFES